MQIFGVMIVALFATFGVYGLVAAIVRIDNVSFWLIKKEYIKSGNFLISLMPNIIQVLTVVGTVAMLLVGGEILIHNIAFIHHLFEVSLLNGLIVGSIGGVFALVVWKIILRIKN